MDGVWSMDGVRATSDLGRTMLAIPGALRKGWVRVTQPQGTGDQTRRSRSAHSSSYRLVREVQGERVAKRQLAEGSG